MTGPTPQDVAGLLEEAADKIISVQVCLHDRLERENSHLWCEACQRIELRDRLGEAARSLRAAPWHQVPVGDAEHAAVALQLKLERAYAENDQLCATLRDHECGPQRGYDSPGTAEQPSRRTAQNDRPDNAASRGQDSALLAEDRIGEPPEYAGNAPMEIGQPHLADCPPSQRPLAGETGNPTVAANAVTVGPSAPARSEPVARFVCTNGHQMGRAKCLRPSCGAEAIAAATARYKALCDPCAESGDDSHCRLQREGAMEWIAWKCKRTGNLYRSAADHAESCYETDACALVRLSDAQSAIAAAREEGQSEVRREMDRAVAEWDQRLASAQDDNEALSAKLDTATHQRYEALVIEAERLLKLLDETEISVALCEGCGPIYVDHAGRCITRDERCSHTVSDEDLLLAKKHKLLERQP